VTTKRKEYIDKKKNINYCERSIMKRPFQDLIVALLILAVCMPVLAEAGGMTGNDLLRRCEWQGEDVAIKIMNDTFCLAFIAGYTDALRTIFRNSETVCMPNQAEWEQRKKVVVKYMNEHPESLHKYYEVLLVEAISKAFPCDGTGTGSQK
jgi:hypothetical protein